MKIIYLLLFVFGFNVVANAQDSLSLKSYFESKNIKATLIADDLYYSANQSKKNVLPKKNDFVKINYKGMLLNGKVFDQSTEPTVFQVGFGQVLEGWDIGIEYLPVGSKSMLYVPAALAFGERGAGDVPANQPVMYEIEVLQILTPAQYDAYTADIEKKEQAAFELRKKQQLDADKKIINEYAIARKLKTKRTDSGLSYVITKAGKGDNAKKGDALSIEYEGLFLSNESFDNSAKNKKPFDFQLGEKKVIEGWEEGLAYFNKGSEGVLLVPSALAYGPGGLYTDTVVIPENSVLVFKIKVIDVKRK